VKRLHKFVISSFLGPFFLTFFIVIFLLLMQFLWKYIEDIAGKGLPASVIAELMFYVSAGLVPMALPLAMLLASLMTMGNLGENYELTAMKASGISLPRIVAPLIIFSISLSLAAFLFANYVLPYTNRKMTRLLYDVTKKKPEARIKDGVFCNDIYGYSIRIEKKDKETGLLHFLRIYKHSEGSGNTTVTLADSGYMRMTPNKMYMYVTLFHGYNYEDVRSQVKTSGSSVYPFRRDSFERQELHIGLSDLQFKESDEGLWKNSAKMMSLEHLGRAGDSLAGQLAGRTNALYRTVLSSYVFRQNFYPPEDPFLVEIRFQPDTVKYPALAAGKVKINHLKYLLLRVLPVRSDTTVKTVSYYRVSDNYIPRPSNVIHTIGAENAAPKFQPFDTVFNSMKTSDRNSIINEALSHARDAKNNISMTSLNNADMTERVRKLYLEWWQKITLSVSCLIFFFIGAPLGAIIRKGGLGMPVVISVIFFVMYYVIMITGIKFAKEGMISIFLGSWIPALILIPIGAFLTQKATKDSSIMNADTYTNFFKKVGAFFNRSKQSSTTLQR
jgi:lipopolysaccharide export system permease protein